MAYGKRGSPRRPLVVGGSGLVGSNLLVLLAATPDCERIRVLDAVPPSPAVLAEAGIPGDKVEFVRHVLGTDPAEALTAALEGVDCVFSLVTPHVQLAAERDFYACNVDGVQSLIQACAAKGVPRLVYLSSIAVSNHFVSSHEQTEAEPLPALEVYESPYDITKRRGEQMVLAASREGLATCALRPGGILLSPNDFTFRNLFQAQGLVAQPYGTEKIDFIDGRDVCRAMLLAAQALAERPAGVAGEAFWITKGEAWYAGDIAALCSQLLGWWLLPVPRPVTEMARCGAWMQYEVKRALGLRIPGVPPHRFMKMAFVEQTFDNSKVRKVLGFEPKVPLSESIARICSLYEAENGRAIGPAVRLISVLAPCLGLAAAAAVVWKVPSLRP